MSGINIISADERLAERAGVKCVIFGKSGVGKTSLLNTLPENDTLFVDLEAGDLPVRGWKGDAIRPRTWGECRDLAVYISGPNPAFRSEQCYSRAHYDAVLKQNGDKPFPEKYRNLFIDSITVAGRLCLQWCKGQPQAMTDKGKEDLRGAYGLHGQEMIAWITHIQHARNKNVFLLGILDEAKDDFGRTVYAPQIDGKKAGNELPGIMDQVITMAPIKFEGVDTPIHSFVTHFSNSYGFPAKDRSQKLEELEEAHLGKLLHKIEHGPILQRTKK